MVKNGIDLAVVVNRCLCLANHLSEDAKITMAVMEANKVAHTEDSIISALFFIVLFFRYQLLPPISVSFGLRQTTD